MRFIQKKSVGMCIFLTIITCGIYGIYWYYEILSDIYYISGRENNAGMDILLTLITCGIYGYYMHYQMGVYLLEARNRLNHYPKDDSILFLVLSLLGLSIVNYAIVQSDINDEFADVVNSF